MKKQTENTSAKSANVASVINWEIESKKIVAFAKANGGSRGDAVARVGAMLTGESKASELLRKACGEAGAQAIISQPRNVLHKLPKLAQCIVSGTSWCSLDGLKPESKRKEDASVAVTLAPYLRDGAEASSRQKAVIAECLNRYTQGGAGAQMPASLEALAFFGIMVREQSADGAKRNAEYKLKNRKLALALMPVA